MLASSALTTLGLGVLAVTLTFGAVVEVWECDAWRFARPTFGAFCSGGIATTSNGSNVRLPLGFIDGDGLVAAFRVGSLPFKVAFVFSGAGLLR